MTETIVEIVEAPADIIEIVSRPEEVFEIVNETSVVEVVDSTGQDIVEIVQDSTVSILEVVVQPEEVLEILEANVPGPQGPQGEPGVPSGLLLVYPAGEVLSGHRIVVLDGEEAFYADHTVLAHAHKVLGMTTGAAMLGADATIQTGGELTEPSWSWVEDTPVWLSTNGLLTQTSPTTGFSLVVGFPITATKLFIDIKIPIILS